MTRKLLSLVTATGMLYVYLLSQLRSDDALFLVASGSLLVNLLLLALAVAAVYVSFQKKFSSARQYLATVSLAIGLSLAGLIGSAYSGLDNYFAGAIKPLDYLILLQLGILFSISSLSSRHQPVRLRLPTSLPRYNPAFVLRLKQQLSSLIQSRPVFPGRPSRGTA